jgi:hypothetical protein
VVEDNLAGRSPENVRLVEGVHSDDTNNCRVSTCLQLVRRDGRVSLCSKAGDHCGYVPPRKQALEDRAEISTTILEPALAFRLLSLHDRCVANAKMPVAVRPVLDDSRLVLSSMLIEITCQTGVEFEQIIPSELKLLFRLSINGSIENGGESTRLPSVLVLRLVGQWLLDRDLAEDLAHLGDHVLVHVLLTHHRRNAVENLVDSIHAYQIVVG